jgi:translocation and assembly module TamB
VDGDVDLGGQRHSQLKVEAQRIGKASPWLDRVRITSEGTAGDHRLVLDVLGHAGDARDVPPHAQFAMNGRYADAEWTASIVSGEIATGEDEQKLTLAEPGTLALAQRRAVLAPLCFAIDNGRLCSEGAWERGKDWNAMVSGYELPLAAFLPPAGRDAQFAGRIEGRIRLFGSRDTVWQGDAGMRIIDAAVIYRPPFGDPEVLNLGTGGLGARATPERLEFSFGVQAFTDTFVFANANIDRSVSRTLQDSPLVGDFRARAADANILPIFFPDIDNAAGLLTAQGEVRGTLSAPQIAGRIELTNGEFDSYRVNLALRDLHLVANLAGNGLDFRGTGRAGDGSLDVNGTFAWHDGISRGQLQLRGQNLLVSDLPEYRVVASPDLRFTIDGRYINASGTVQIPSARIQPADLTGAVQVSDDARYVDEHPAERDGRYVVASDIRIDMGDDVRVESFGLQGRILGGVSTTVRTGQTPIGRGELSVVEGRYEAYGQKLEITRGHLIFEGSPLADPGLDIEARRKFESVIVGLNVRGTLQQPRLSFFSEPTMPQTQIISYLLVGKPVDAMRTSDTATVGSATDALAVQGGGLLASQIGRRLGLEEVGVESTTARDGEVNQQLVLGKFLSPRLFVSYGISLTESINTLKLRYTISDRWVLKTEAGENQSADIEFNIER